MSLLVIGLNHRTAPIDVRERIAFAHARLPEMLGRMRILFPAAEFVLLSTCNRTEVYLNAPDPHAAEQTLTTFLRDRLEKLPVQTHLYCRENLHAAHHLFRVASGLDSMVIGEHEILGQVKKAYLTAHAEGYTGKMLNVLFQRSLHVGKLVRSETGLSLGSSSVGSIAVAMAEKIFRDLHASRVMIIGAGKIAEMTAKHLLAQKVSSVLVANRTYERACDLAAEFGGKAIPFDEILNQMNTVDIVICSTTAPHYIIQPDQVQEIMLRRENRSLFFIDIAVPRNVHPEVQKIHNAFLYNVDDLQGIVNESLSRRAKEVSAAEKIIEEETLEFGRWLDAVNSGQEHAMKHYSHQSAIPIFS
jgi:glutamyl-tRNA reductase